MLVLKNKPVDFGESRFRFRLFSFELFYEDNSSSAAIEYC